MNITFIASLVIAGLINQHFHSCTDNGSEDYSYNYEPYVFNIELDKTTDDITVLMAAAAERSPGLNVKWPNRIPKHFWIEDFDNFIEYLEWTVHVEEQSSFHVDVLLNTAEGEEFEITVNDGPAALKFKSAIEGWDKVEAGVLSLAKGLNIIKLSKLTNKSITEVKSLELIQNNRRNEYLQRVANFRNDATWLANSGYGLMFQYGTWCYPETGDKRKNLDELAETFDITSFAKMVQETGTAYVIWSLTWREYKLLMPVEAVDRIVGNSVITASKNFILELARELNKHGIRFMLYYHLGHDSNLDKPTLWWSAQAWPQEFSSTGLGDREIFFANWIDVISEIGETLGIYLDAWWFDDGLCYYPAPFEKLGTAARKGNPDRLISYNSWICSRYTDFQDIYFGEGSHGEMQPGSSPKGGNGIFITGPQKGLLQHGMFKMESTWGIYKPDQQISNIVDEHDVIAWVKSASDRRVPITLNMVMWEDGTVCESSLGILNALRKELGK